MNEMMGIKHAYGDDEEVMDNEHEFTGKPRHAKSVSKSHAERHNDEKRGSAPVTKKHTGQMPAQPRQVVTFSGGRGGSYRIVNGKKVYIKKPKALSAYGNGAPRS